MAVPVLIIGRSGSGKSASMRTCVEKDFALINVLTQTSHIKNGVCTLKNQYFSAQNSNQAAFCPYSRASRMYFGSL